MWNEFGDECETIYFGDEIVTKLGVLFLICDMCEYCTTDDKISFLGFKCSDWLLYRRRR